MSEVTEAIEQQDPDFVEIPEGYADFVKFRETGELPEAAEKDPPAVSEEETPQSESSEEDKSPEGQIAEESDPKEDEAEQVQDPEPEPEKEKDSRLARRMRKLTGTIADLQSRLDAMTNGEAEEEAVTEEVASSTETVDEGSKEIVRPMLRDYEDTDEKSAWDQYEEAIDAYYKALGAKQVKDALTTKERELEEKHSRELAQTEWNRAASRYPDFNEVVREEVKISAAMESVMRMDPEAGTDLAYYLGQHPEESEKIAKATLATNETQWALALARAGMLLGQIRTKIAPPVKPADKEPVKPAAAPAPKPATKQVSTANRPPAQIKGKAVPKTDVNNADDARDFKKWKQAREAQLTTRKR